MTYRFKNITGSLNALLVFESVAHNLSFTQAATELNLSQPTISRHIASLEGRLNRSLFTRSGNQIKPTAEARRLASAIALGFGHAETAWEDIQYTTRRDEVTLACSFGFVDNWLMPRYTGLKRYLGKTRLKIATLDTPTEQEIARADIAVVWDTRLSPDRPSFPLFTEEAFPVCSPQYLTDHPDIQNGVAALAEAELLHFDVQDSGFINWRLWFAAQGIDYRPAEEAQFHDALPFYTQSLLEGEGIGLGWRYLVDQKLAQQQLVQVGPSLVNRQVAYYLQYREDSPNRTGIRKVVDWFKNAIPAD